MNQSTNDAILSDAELLTPKRPTRKQLIWGLFVVSLASLLLDRSDEGPTRGLVGTCRHLPHDTTRNHPTDVVRHAQTDPLHRHPDAIRFRLFDDHTHDWLDAAEYIA